MSKNKKDNKEAAPELVSFEVLFDSFDTTLNKTYLSRKKYEPADPNKLRAFMPGTIQKIHVAEGETMKKGGKLMILEAMKMKNIIAAPFDCKVVKLNAKEGDMVPKSVVLIEVEPADLSIPQEEK